MQSRTVTMGTNVYIGMAVTGNSTTTLATGTFNNVTVTGGGGSPTATPTATNTATPSNTPTATSAGSTATATPSPPPTATATQPPPTPSPTPPPAPDPEVVIRRVTYSVAGQAIALRVTGDPAGNNGIYYLHSDQLGSNSVISTLAGSKVSETRYLPFGDYRTAPTGIGNTLTDRGYTGQKENMEIGLIYYNARFYVPGIGRFASADTIVPDPANPQSFNRYSYVENRPLNFSDPTGRIPCEELGIEECDPEGNFVDAPPTPDEILNTWSGKESLPLGGDGIDAAVWLYRQMIGNANSQDAQNLRNDWNSGNGLLYPLRDSVLKANALLGFKNLVDYGEAWDFKEDFVEGSIDNVMLAGNQFRMDIVANIHYGYLGEDIGFPDILLYGGAGFAQQLGPRPELGRWWAYGDQPEDMSAISLGIHMRRDYGPNLSYDEFVYAINLWVDNGWLDEYLVP